MTKKTFREKWLPWVWAVLMATTICLLIGAMLR